MAFYFILSCCWDFGGKNSKNSLEFCLPITVDLEELLLHGAQFPSPLFIPRALDPFIL